MKIKTKAGYYLKNADLVREILDFKKNSVASETLGKYLLLIARNLSTSGSFNGYTWRTDMVSEATLTCIKYLRNYKPEKSPNAFAYVTQICRHSFIAYIKNEKTHSEIKDKCYKRSDELALIMSENNTAKKAINYQEIGEKRRKKVIAIS
jgi:hypothetical protein